MRGVGRIVAVVAVSALMAAACGDDDDGDGGGGEVFTDPATPIEVSVGDDFTIQLEATPGTGYSWELAQQPPDNVIASLGSDFAHRGDPEPGAAGDQSLSFRAVGAGDAVIALQYVRPWETDVAPARTEDFTVTVS